MLFQAIQLQMFIHSNDKWHYVQLFSLGDITETIPPLLRQLLQCHLSELSFVI